MGTMDALTKLMPVIPLAVLVWITIHLIIRITIHPTCQEFHSVADKIIQREGITDEELRLFFQHKNVCGRHAKVLRHIEDDDARKLVRKLGVRLKGQPQ